MRRAFTLIELLVVIAIIGILIGILLPVTNRARGSARVVACASNLKQIGEGLLRYRNDHKVLPARPGNLVFANPHVLRYQDQEFSVAELMEKYVGSRKILYCPANTLGRNVETWWPYSSGTIAGTYQYPFWLIWRNWVCEREQIPDYRKLTSTRVIAADYLGVAAFDNGTTRVIAWNHEKTKDDSPRGMNMLFGDGHVSWHHTQFNWQIYGFGFGQVYWFFGRGYEQNITPRLGGD